MKIVFVGAGRLAVNMAHALCQKGHHIVAVYSRTMASARALTALVGGTPTDDLSLLPQEADAFILALKDDALPVVIPALTEGRAGQLFFHTAGSMPLSVFESYARHAGVIYPMQTFSKERLVDFTGIPVFIEATDDATLQRAETLMRDVSHSVSRLDSEGRRYLHLAAVFACNFANHCYALSAELLSRREIPFSVMLPLINETARKVNSIAPRQAQTGPAVRYDRRVIDVQRQLLSDSPVLQQIYELMSDSIHLLADAERSSQHPFNQ